MKTQLLKLLNQKAQEGWHADVLAIGEADFEDIVNKVIELFKHKEKKEYILCSAIWYKELPTMKYLPKNVDKGVVLCGLRHANIINQMAVLTKIRTVTNIHDGCGEHEQGFLTSQNRFVNRSEARKIALDAKQVKLCDVPTDTIYSEDLW